MAFLPWVTNRATAGACPSTSYHRPCGTDGWHFWKDQYTCKIAGHVGRQQLPGMQRQSGGAGGDSLPS